ncbi:MAG: NAD(P)-binding domain-containing protein [Burkholderiales bacterium]
MKSRDAVSVQIRESQVRTTTVVIGAGQAGLAMSWWLASYGIEHVVLERGEPANSWRNERWDSLRLLTPNWQSRLPGYSYQGDDPDGFRTMSETVDFIQSYAREMSAPVHTHTAVEAVRQGDDGYVVVTDKGTWQCDTVVIASGACNIASVPKVSESVPPGTTTLTTLQYRNPGQVPEGGVLVVGASASGTQIADELQRAGRCVTLAVGEHVRLPRRYRGKDVLWWMDATGILNESYKDIDDIVRARNLPSMQLAGYPDQRMIDLNSLTDIGVKLVGRLAGFNDGKAQFSGSLRNVCSLADLKMNRLLNAIDEWTEDNPPAKTVDESHRFDQTRVDESPPLLVDFARSGINTIIWATGFRPDYSWLHVPVLDHKGYIRHDGGVVTESPGLYVIGLPFLRRRKSTLIDGVGDDARDLSTHLAGYLKKRKQPAHCELPAVAS